MSGSLCGPSNALQSLSKHTSVDRSLHRDRPAPNRSQVGTPLSGFRTAASHVNPQAEHEFASFVGAIPGRSPAAFEHLQVAPGPQFAAPHESWANDFQRLEIGPLQPGLPTSKSALRNTPQTHQMVGTTGQWQRDFSMMSAEPSATFSAHSMMPMMQNTYNLGGANFTHMPALQTSSISEQQHKVKDEFLFDESAFENAFEMAARQLDETPAVEGVEPEVLETAVDQDKPVEEQRVPEHDGDELARTAGQLLESVKDDSSEKFQKSNFLALMRRLRDHEVVIQGDTMVSLPVDDSLPPKTP